MSIPHDAEYWREYRKVWRKQPPPARYRAIEALTNAEVAALNWWWLEEARPNQLPPPGDWSLWLLLAGRGFGKTRTLAEFANLKAESLPGLHGIVAAPTAADIRDVLVEGPSGILSCANPNFMPHYEPSKRRLTWPNGAWATLISADRPAGLRGPQCHWFIADELAVWRYPAAWDMLMFGFRLGENPQGAVATTPKGAGVLRELLAEPGLVKTTGTTYDNKENLSPKFFERTICRYEGTRLGRQELLAELLDDAEGALWKREWIEASRKLAPGDLMRAGVAMDPAATGHGDECGIIAGGVALVGRTPHLYVTTDGSLRGSPEQQARAAIALYHITSADCIIVEANNGGEWIPTVIHQIDPSVPVRLVHASRGKRTRAEPVSALYEQGRAHHVGTLAALEDEMCQWEPGRASPNRMDALVWLATELALKTSQWGLVYGI